MQVDRESWLYIRSVCTRYVGCTGCPLAGGVATYFGDCVVICENGKGKVVNEQGTGSDGNGTNKAGDVEGQE